jgi:UDP-N-acetylglucosamine enolpyruvyl transferase
MSKRFVISGRQQLSGAYPVQGSKNAALPLISAALLSKSIIHFQNVPRIADVDGLLQLVESLDVKTQWENGTLSGLEKLSRRRTAAPPGGKTARGHPLTGIHGALAGFRLLSDARRLPHRQAFL